jgi:hypothetical protein
MSNYLGSELMGTSTLRGSKVDDQVKTNPPQDHIQNLLEKMYRDFKETDRRLVMDLGSGALKKCDIVTTQINGQFQQNLTVGEFAVQKYTPLDLTYSGFENNNHFWHDLMIDQKEFEFAINLKQHQGTDDLGAIDVLYNHVYDLIKDKKFRLIDCLASFIIFLNFNLRITISLLTITHTIKEKITQRGNLLKYANSVAANEGLTAEQIKSVLIGF